MSTGYQQLPPMTPESAQYSEDTFRRIIDRDGHNKISGIRYTSISLGNLAAGLTDTDVSTPDNDADMMVNISHVVIRWGGNGHPLVPGRMSDAMVFGEYAVHDGPWVEDALLGAHIGDRAMAYALETRSQAAVQAAGFLAEGGQEGGQALSSLFGALGVPKAAVQIGSVLSSTVIPKGVRVATLWHPVILPADIALESIKTAVRELKAQG